MLIEKFICVQVKYALSKMLEPEVFQTPFFRLWNICTDTMRHLEDFMYNSYAPRLKVNLYTISSTPVFGCGLSMRSGVEFSTCGIMSAWWRIFRLGLLVFLKDFGFCVYPRQLMLFKTSH
jgi:hypothetical protein